MITLRYNASSVCVWGTVLCQFWSMTNDDALYFKASSSTMRRSVTLLDKICTNWSCLSNVSIRLFNVIRSHANVLYLDSDVVKQWSISIQSFIFECKQCTGYRLNGRLNGFVVELN
jgi:hypothetical protein